MFFMTFNVDTLYMEDIIIKIIIIKNIKVSQNDLIRSLFILTERITLNVSTHRNHFLCRSIISARELCDRKYEHTLFLCQKVSIPPCAIR